jgi:hypothetical protein
MKSHFNADIRVYTIITSNDSEVKLLNVRVIEVEDLILLDCAVPAYCAFFPSEIS